MYNDSLWPSASHTTSNNPRNLTTPTSLYASDYGFNTGTLLYRGHFVATGTETSFFIETQGGTAFAHSTFINDQDLGSWPGISTAENYNQTLPLPALSAGEEVVLTIIIDNMGLDENQRVGIDEMKNPRGILRYDLAGCDPGAIGWKITGNLGGEDYRDKIRGPLNEGGLFAERMGYHLPDPPSEKRSDGSPFDGLKGAGISFYTTTVELDLPYGYDIPLAFEFTNTTSDDGTGPAEFRSQLYVNGYQFGKYGTFPLYPVSPYSFSLPFRSFPSPSVLSRQPFPVLPSPLSFLRSPPLFSPHHPHLLTHLISQKSTTSAPKLSSPSPKAS